MHNFKISFLFVFVLFLVGGCRSKKQVVTYKKKPKKEVISNTEKPVIVSKKEPDTDFVPVVPAKNISYQEKVEIYIANFSDIAIQEMKKYGIPASITLAQGILESGAGVGELTKNSNNHFGIKCHTGWTGARVYHDDDKHQECFRKYQDPRDSFEDHSLFLSSRSRYKGLFNLDKRDYKGWARGLRKAGYATDPKYPQKLISIIERYNLHKFDMLDASSFNDESNLPAEDLKTYIVKKGDTLYSISKKFNITVEQLKKTNNLKNNTLSIGQLLKIK
jgi:flagellum-specific peptidoglycan hydrolase FlgJ